MTVSACRREYRKGWEQTCDCWADPHISPLLGTTGHYWADVNSSRQGGVCGGACAVKDSTGLTGSSHRITKTNVAFQNNIRRAGLLENLQLLWSNSVRVLCVSMVQMYYISSGPQSPAGFCPCCVRLQTTPSLTLWVTSTRSGVPTETWSHDQNTFCHFLFRDQFQIFPLTPPFFPSPNSESLEIRNRNYKHWNDSVKISISTLAKTRTWSLLN